MRTSQPALAGGSRNLGQGNTGITPLSTAPAPEPAPHSEKDTRALLCPPEPLSVPQGREEQPRNLLLWLQKQGEAGTAAVGAHRECVWAAGLTATGCTSALPCPPEHSPGVWHRAEGTPRKGGLKWGPRAMWGAFWGDSRGGGWEISLQRAENKALLKTWRLQSPGSGRTSWLQMSCILPQRLLPLHPHAELLK